MLRMYYLSTEIADIDTEFEIKYLVIYSFCCFILLFQYRFLKSYRCVYKVAYFFMLYVFTVCWTQIDHVHGYNGQHQRNIFTVSACQAACVSNQSCVAIDFDPGNPIRRFCWLLTSTATGPGQNITHYVLNRACTGTPLVK